VGIITAMAIMDIRKWMGMHSKVHLAAVSWSFVTSILVFYFHRLPSHLTAAQNGHRGVLFSVVGAHGYFHGWNDSFGVTRYGDLVFWGFGSAGVAVCVCLWEYF